MLDVLIIVAWFLVAIIILVSIHELGHFSVARLCGVKVLRFSIGFGRQLFTVKDKSGTEFTLSAIPLGGYVKMLDEREGEVDQALLDQTYNSKSVGQRIAILAAGPAANFILAFFLYISLFAGGTTQLVPQVDHVKEGSPAAAAGFEVGQEILAVDGVETSSSGDVMAELINRLGESGELVFTVRYGDSSLRYDLEVPIDDWLQGVHAPDPLEDLGFSFFRAIVDKKIVDLVEDGAAAKAGFKVGDEPMRVNGEPVPDWQTWVSQVKSSPGKALDVIVLREGEELNLQLIPDTRTDEALSFGFAGVMASTRAVPENMLRRQSYGFLGSINAAAKRTVSDSKMVLLSIKKLIVGEISTKNLSGPIGIAKVAASQAQHGVSAFIAFLAYLSVVLGVMNLLPIPVLDGGHILYCLIEWVAGKPVSEKIQLMGLQAGLAVLACVMAVAFYNDILHL